MPRAPVYVTKKEFNDYKKEVFNLIKEVSRVAKKNEVKKVVLKKKSAKKSVDKA